MSKSAEVIQLEGATLRQQLLTPIATISDYVTEISQSLPGDDMLREDLSRISDGCRNLRTQVGDLIEGQVLLNTREAGDLSKIRHDLKNPLNSIIGYAEIIIEESDGTLPENYMALLQHVVELGSEISGTIDSAFRHAANEEAQADEEAAIERLFASLNESSMGITINDEIAGSPILIVDDNPTNQDILRRRLEKHGFNCMLADNGHQALAIIEEHQIDLVLLDLLMPDMNGIEVLHAIRSNPGKGELPIIIVSGLNDARGIAKCLSHGATDYLAKPVEPLILDAKVVSALERFAYRRELNVLATTDQLTQLLNRRAVMARFDHIVEQHLAEEISFGMLLLDIDFFKKVNDTYGHNGGDAVLQNFAQCLKNEVRSTDVVGRMGGEEFIAIVQGTSIDDFHNICERIRASVENLSCEYDGLKIKITTSGGTYFSSELETSIKQMINIADQRLYGAKNAGRNRIQHLDTQDA